MDSHFIGMIAFAITTVLFYAISLRLASKLKRKDQYLQQGKQHPKELHQHGETKPKLRKEQHPKQ